MNDAAMVSTPQSDGPASDLETSGWSTRERDLDNLLLEELAASSDFRKWLLNRLLTVIDVPEHRLSRARRNEQRDVAVGQTDIGFSLLDAAGSDLCLLHIENKIMSGYQPGQPERYRAEVQAARQRLGPRRAAAILVAPSANRLVRDHPGYAHFDVDIPLEDIADYFETRISMLAEPACTTPERLELLERLKAKAELLDCLLGRGPRAQRHRSPDASRVAFLRQMYAEAFARHGRNFEVTDPTTAGKKSTTVLYTPRVPLPGGLPLKSIRHDFGGKNEVSAVLEDFGDRRHVIAAALAELRGARIETGKPSRVPGKHPALFVRLDTPPMDVSRPVEEQEAEFAAALDRVGLLLEWATRHGEQIMAANARGRSEAG